MKNNKFLASFILSLLIFFTLSSTAANNFTAKITRLRYETIPVLILTGSYTAMGQRYGQALKPQLHQILAILQAYYNQKGISYHALVAQADLLYQRFPANYRHFIQGMAKGAKLKLNAAKILNAMETLPQLLPQPQEAQCAFLFIPPNDTKKNAAVIGRNYDYSAPFNRLAQYLTVTIIITPHTIPTAFIAIPGEIYCPSCVNAKGLFMELNSGSPSGGHFVNTQRQSLLINMLTMMQQSASLTQLANKLKTIQADFSLIVNTADKNNAKSFEYSSTLGMKFYNAIKNWPFVSTNFYLNPDWKNKIPLPTDATTWMGETRRNNLLHLAHRHSQFDLSSAEKLMATNITQGGAFWHSTIYQLIFDESDLSLYIKIVSHPNHWVRIPLGKIFKNYVNATPLSFKG